MLYRTRSYFFRVVTQARIKLDLLSSGICLTDIYHLAWCMLRVKFNGIVIAIADIFFTTYLLFSPRLSEKDSLAFRHRHSASTRTLMRGITVQFTTFIPEHFQRYRNDSLRSHERIQNPCFLTERRILPTREVNAVFTAL